ncbi:acyl-CoA thioesterase [Microvirga sp. 2YAF29]|uniref:acyl-CoA thioesterase n=1 Tax=Microvirga sp. 2YAF29 TaxID=3233031 RepID=UPI003F94EDC7
MSTKPTRRHRSTYPVFRPITTRWMDNDAYGHANNVHYYSYFDSAVNGLLVEKGLLSIGDSPVIGLVVESGCAYFESAAFPEKLEAGISVAHLGRSSVRYEIGIFKEGAEFAAAQGHFVHVYVDRETQRPVEIPPEARRALSELFSTDR